MKRLLLMSGAALLAMFVLASPAPWAIAEDAKDDSKGWEQLFNGKDLTGWKTHPKDKGHWEVKDGAITGIGPEVGHLFTERGDFENFHVRVEAKISDKGNSGLFFRTQFGTAYPYPAGYEAQIDSTHSDPIRTGSLYPGRIKLTRAEREKIIVRQQLHKPDELFTEEVIAKGNHIVIKVNGKTTVDFVDTHNTFTKGHFALQLHGGKVDGKPTIVEFRKVEVKELPPGQ
jgi:hypothetical protein